LAAVQLVSPAHSLAQAATGTVVDNPVKADFKGTIGVGLIGAELGFVVPALAGARGAWAYIVFPLIGAGGGGAAGYFLLEKGTGHPELAVASLVTGMALLIPSLVLTLAETAYEPEESTVGSMRSRLTSATAAGPGLVRWSDRGVLVAPPGVSVGPLVSASEALRTGATRTSVVQASVLSGVF
jgi:hypothetical protein